MGTSFIKAVCFDVGETLIDESRLWRLWADWLRVPRAEFERELREVITRGEPHTRVFERFRPGFDLVAARVEREAAGWPPDVFAAEDLYPDAVPCLLGLKSAGYIIAAAGNHTMRSEAVLAEAGIRLDVIGSSERWGVEKPSAAFFERLSREVGLEAREIAYVGDRLDYDVLPAVRAGMSGFFLARGPWGEVHSRRPDVSKATFQIDGLSDLLEIFTEPA